MLVLSSVAMVAVLATSRPHDDTSTLALNALHPGRVR